jgi:hypothetical protein
MAKVSVPCAATSAPQAARTGRCRGDEGYFMRFHQSQAKRVRHWHNGPHVEEIFRREEERKMNLKWKQDQIEILVPCQSAFMMQGNRNSKVVWTSVTEIAAQKSVSSKDMNYSAGQKLGLRFPRD